MKDIHPDHVKGATVIMFEKVRAGQYVFLHLEGTEIFLNRKMFKIMEWGYDFDAQKWIVILSYWNNKKIKLFIDTSEFNKEPLGSGAIIRKLKEMGILDGLDTSK